MKILKSFIQVFILYLHIYMYILHQGEKVTDSNRGWKFKARALNLLVLYTTPTRKKKRNL